MPNKPHTGKFFNCLQCLTQFYVPLNRFKTAKYCSRKCLALHQRVQITQICKICHIEFEHISSRCNKAKYCSRKCFHKSRKDKGKTIYICTYCKKEFNDSFCRNRKYCSKACNTKCERENWRPKITTVRKKMIKENLVNKCEICGYNEVKEILGIHHKDCNKNNNSKENLQVLCPMCHSLIHRKHISH